LVPAACVGFAQKKRVGAPTSNAYKCVAVYMWWRGYVRNALERLEWGRDEEVTVLDIVKRLDELASG
jgi:hypothetical protein